MAVDKERDDQPTPRGAEARPRRPAPAARPTGAAPAETPRVVRPAEGPDQPSDAPRAAKPSRPAKPRHRDRPAAKPAAKSSPGTAPDRAGDPRAAALALLTGVRAGRSLDEQIEAGALDGLAASERARAQRLAALALRHRSRAEAVLDPLLPRRPRPIIADLLLLATVEMLASGAAPHGVVSEAVALARRQGQKSAAAAGMVNAVLRRAADGASTWAASGPPILPDWLRGPVAAQWGEAVAAAIEAAHERGAPIDVTPKPGVTLDGAEVLPTGSLRLPAGAQVSALPGFASGDWWVQDAASALPARLLDPRRGERIADLCAAPGGKTMQLAAAGARVTAVDIAPARLERLSQNLARCELEAEVVAADALEWRPAEGTLDAILLDAPCSATGTIRRHPELPLIRDGSGLDALIALQGALIDHAVSLLPPGGRLVYATCSLLAEEGEAQAAAALARHPDLGVETPDPARLGVDPAWITPEGGLRLRPDLWAERGGMDGFYMVLFGRAGG